MARIGPNAITRLAEALRAELGEADTARLFAIAGLAPYLARPPLEMVEESEVLRLHHALREQLGERRARGLAAAAGGRTADYLLAHRIPQPLQAVLRRLPARLACRLLLAAIGRHAWTFAGSGHFAVTRGWPPQLTISGNPLCRGLRSREPVCSYYAATFERLHRALVQPQARVVETACAAVGAPACVFDIRW